MISPIKNFYLKNRANDRTKQLWTEEIKKHQQLSSNLSCFHVCVRHFNVNDIIIYPSGRTILQQNAVPMIFEEKDVEISENDCSNDIPETNNAPENHKCDECEIKNEIISELKKELCYLKTERQCDECIWKELSITELKKQFLEMKIGHDIEIQKKNVIIEMLNSENAEQKEKSNTKNNDDVEVGT